MKVLGNIFFLVLLILTVNARAESLPPVNAIKKVIAAFPGCNISWSSVGPLYGKNSKDVASSLYCEADRYKNEKEESGPYAIAILAEGNNGEYRIAYENRGNFLDFVAEIKKGSLFLHAGLPGTGGGQTATSYDYQFRYDGRKMMLIGMETDSIYVGFEQPTKDQEFQISVNCLTGMVIDSRVSWKPKKMAGLRKVSLEEFDYERGCRGY